MVTSKGFPLLSTQDLKFLLTSLRMKTSVSPNAVGSLNAHSGQ